MKTLSKEVHKIIRAIFKKQHLLLPDIIINWYKIVGLYFGKHTLPLKILTIKEHNQKINVLYIKIDNPSLSVKISFQQEIIIERITAYLGFKAVHKLRLVV